MMKRCLALFVALICLGMLVSCADIMRLIDPPTDEELITERIQEFVTAYNNGDMDTVLECFDAKSRSTLKASIDLIRAFSGGYIDMSALFSLGVNLTEGEFMKLEISAIKVTDSKNATATATMELQGGGTQTLTFEMVFENEGWYIHDLDY